MKIKEIQAVNVKSFKKDTKLSFGNINIFIGKNSSGKSNIINVLRLLIQIQPNLIITIPPYNGDF